MTDLFEGFKWTEGETKTFQNLEDTPTSSPMLDFSDFNLSFTVETYACDVSIGVLIMKLGELLVLSIGRDLEEMQKTIS